MDLGIFEADKFTLQELTAAINEAPALPSRLAGLGLFDEEGIQTTSLVVEKDVDTLALVPNQSRTATPVATGGSARSVTTFVTTHLPTQDTITADQIQNLRAFGTAGEVETMRDFVDKRLAKMRRRIDATVEFQRVGALKGQIIDADGVTVIVNLFTAFGLVQQTHLMALDADATKVRTKVMEAVEKSEDALGSEPYERFRCLCGRDFFRSLVEHPNVVKAYERFQDGAALRNDVRDGFEFSGVVFEQYRGAIAGTPFIGADEAYLFPTGVNEMFITRFAPANYVETANTIGLPLYAKQEPKPLGKGIDVEAQSNPISLCTRPRAVIKLSRLSV